MIDETLIFGGVFVIFLGAWLVHPGLAVMLAGGALAAVGVLRFRGDNGTD